MRKLLRKGNPFFHTLCWTRLAALLVVAWVKTATVKHSWGTCQDLVKKKSEGPDGRTGLTAMRSEARKRVKAPPARQAGDRRMKRFWCRHFSVGKWGTLCEDCHGLAGEQIRTTTGNFTAKGGGNLHPLARLTNCQKQNGDGTGWEVRLWEGPCCPRGPGARALGPNNLHASARNGLRTAPLSRTGGRASFAAPPPML